MKSHSSAAARPSPPGRRKPPLVSAALMGTGIGLLSLLLLLLLFCMAASGAENPGPLVAPFALCSLYLAGLAAGVAGARISGAGPLGGLMSGTFFLCAVFLLSALPLPDSGFPASAGWIFLLLLLPAAALGGILGTRKTKKYSPVRSRR